MVVTMTTLGKVAISASFTVIYLHSSEIFPTSIRNTGMGLMAITSRMGGIASPYFASLGDLYPNLHLVLFCVLPLSAGALYLRVPETLGRSLPETMDDLAAMVSSTARSGKDKEQYGSPAVKYRPLPMATEYGSDIEEQGEPMSTKS